MKEATDEKRDTWRDATGEAGEGLQNIRHGGNHNTRQEQGKTKDIRKTKLETNKRKTKQGGLKTKLETNARQFQKTARQN